MSRKDRGSRLRASCYLAAFLHKAGGRAHATQTLHTNREKQFCSSVRTPSKSQVRREQPLALDCIRSCASGSRFPWPGTGLAASDLWWWDCLSAHAALRLLHALVLQRSCRREPTSRAIEGCMGQEHVQPRKTGQPFRRRGPWS
jgi:hypothetical protein